MYKLKLIKGRSYTGYGLKASVTSPFVEVNSKEVSDSLIAGGYFSLVTEAETFAEEAESLAIENETTEGGSAEPETNLEEMTLVQLKELAGQMVLDVKGLKSKADYIKAINEAEELFSDED